MSLSQKKSTQLDKSDSIQKVKRLETTYQNYSRLLWNLFNVTYMNVITTGTKYSSLWGCERPLWNLAAAPESQGP